MSCTLDQKGRQPAGDHVLANVSADRVPYRPAASLLRQLLPAPRHLCPQLHSDLVQASKHSH